MQISKALLVQNHPDSIWFVDSLFNVLNDEHIGWDAARAIGEIGAADNILTKRNHAIVKVYALRDMRVASVLMRFTDFICPKIFQQHASAHNAGSEFSVTCVLRFLSVI